MSSRLALLLALLVAIGWAEDGEGGAWVREHQRPPSFFDLVGGTIAPVQPDGTVDATAFAEALRRMNEDVGRQVILRPEDPNRKATEASQVDPLRSEQGWRLWVFWAMDAPECAGLGNELIRLRSANLCQIRPVHLAGLRNWESWVWSMDDYRSRILRAAKAGDRQGVQAIWLAWKGEIEPVNTIIEAFYGKAGVSVIGDTRAAIALKVRSVPTFRLIAPSGRIHALDGFTPDTSLIGWVQKAQAWEQAQR